MRACGSPYRHLYCLSLSVHIKPLVEKTCPYPCISEDWNLYAETPATDDFGNHCNSNIDICCVSFTPDCTRLLSFDGCAGIYARERPVSWINQSEQPIRIARFFIKGPICGSENGQVGDGLADSTLPTMEGEPRHRRTQRWHCQCKKRKFAHTFSKLLP